MTTFYTYPEPRPAMTRPGDRRRGPGGRAGRRRARADRLGGSAPRRADQHRAGAVGRRHHRAARLAAGHGARQKTRPGAAVDRGVDRAVRRRPERRPDRSGGASDRSLGRLDGDGGIVDGTLVAPGAAGGSGGGARRRGGGRAALRRRLLARARMRDAADWLARRPSSGAMSSRAGCRR